MTGGLFDDLGGSKLEDAFLRFHRGNPHVYESFKRFTWEAIRAGRTRYSARTIWHRMRWHLHIETKSADDFKLNDHHTPYYARMFMRDHPQYDGLFELRVTQGERG